MSVGSVLAAARSMQGRSIEELTAATRIRPHVIRAIEADDYAVCGGDVYTRGHVRALARVLGVNAEPLLSELAGGGPALPAPATGSANPGSIVIRPAGRAPRWAMVLAVVLTVIAGLAAFRLWSPGGGRPAAVALRTPSSHRAAPATRTPAPVASSRPAGGLAVSLRVTGSRCWISVTGSDGGRRLASVLTQGQTAQFTDHAQLSIVLGNPSAVRVSVNGRRVKPAASSGITRFVVKADGRTARAGGSPTPSAAA